MSLVMHIFKKDVRRLRLFLIFWFPIVLIAAAANVIRLAAENYVLQAFQQLIIELTGGLQFLVMTLMVPNLIHSEPLMGTTAFWLTRPVKNTDIMKGKLLFAGIFFVVLPILINILSLITCKVSTTYILPMILEYFILYTGRLLLLMAIASLTRNFGQYTLVGGIYLIIGIIVGAIIGFTKQYNGSFDFLSGSALTDSRHLLSNTVGIVLLALLIYTQYRRRSLLRSYSLLALECVLSLWIAFHSPWCIFKTPTSELSEKKAEHITLTISKSDLPGMHDIKAFDGKTKKQIHGYIETGGLPPRCFAQVNQIDPVLQIERKKINSLGIKPYRFANHYYNKEALQEALEPLDLILRGYRSHYPNDLFQVTESDYLKIKDKTGVYRANTKLDVFRYQVKAKLPLGSGDEYTTDRTRIKIETVLRKTEGCAIIVKEQQINPLFKRDRRPLPGSRYLYILANRETGEAYQSEPHHVGSAIGKVSLTIHNLRLQFSSMDRIGSSIDEQWLEGAELIIVEAEWQGEVNQHIEDPAFPVGSPEAVATVPGTSANDNLSALKAITLPDYATPQEALEYIQRINVISDTQEHADPTDPQVAMLAKVGKENINLLLRHPGQHSLYANEAIRLIEGFNPPEPSTILKDTDAIIEGTIGHYEQYSKIAWWSRPEDKIRFHVPDMENGRYALYVTYSAPLANGGRLSIQLNDTEINKYFEGTGSWGTQREKWIGMVEHKGGALDIIMSILEQKVANEPTLDLYSLRLEPIDEYPGPTAIVLSSDDAILEGHIGHNKEWRKIGWWSRPEDKIRFTIPALQQGTYRVSAVYAAPGAHGGKIAFEINNQEHRRILGSTGGGWGTVIEKYIGHYAHEGGEANITMTMLEQNGEGQAVLDLFSILLERVEPNAKNEHHRILFVNSGLSRLKKNAATNGYLGELEKVVLPENLTRDAVKTYIQKTNETSSTQSRASETDPQVKMLVKDEAESLDLLINSAGSQWHEHDVMTINKLARPEDKDLILQNLYRLKTLSVAVLKYGWHKDARETLIKGLKESDRLPKQWLICTLLLEDPETYPYLCRYLSYGDWPLITYDLIKDLPGIELNDAIAQAWKNAKYADAHARRKMLPLAMEYGHQDALNLATLLLAGVKADASDDQKKHLRQKIEQLTGISGSNDEIRRWYLANKDKLKFDPVTKWRGDLKPLDQASIIKDQLSKIKLPDHPTRDEVKIYIQQIKSISSKQTWELKTDPQVEMLVKVGAKNLDLLIDSAGSRWNEHAIMAINELARPEDKELILQNLERSRFLVDTVIKYGWHEDAREILLKGLKECNRLPVEWLRATLYLEDPETYPYFYRYLIHGHWRPATYDLIKDLPRIELDDAVAQAWNKAKYQNAGARREMIAIAVQYGHEDALQFAIRVLISSDSTNRQKKTLRKSIQAHTGQTGTDEELHEWYLTNKEHLQFDAEKKMFVVEQM